MLMIFIISWNLHSYVNKYKFTCEYNINMLLKYRAPLSSTVCTWTNMKTPSKSLKVTNVEYTTHVLRISLNLYLCEHNPNMLLIYKANITLA